MQKTIWKFTAPLDTQEGGQSAKSLKMANIQLAQIIKNLLNSKKKDIITKFFSLNFHVSSASRTRTK